MTARHRHPDCEPRHPLAVAPRRVAGAVLAGVAALVGLGVLPAAGAAQGTGCARVGIATENARAGGTGWQTAGTPQPSSENGPFVRTLTTPLVQGYSSATSVACGQRIGLHLGTMSSHRVVVRIQAWRLGYYRGRGGRLVWQSRLVSVRRPHTWLRNAPNTHMITAPWPTTTTISVPHTWTQGAYELRIVPVVAPARAAVVPLVVRDPTKSTALVQVLSVNTWQMYNDWGGWSAYSVPRSRVVSFDRPYAGIGWGNMMTFEYPLLRYLERTGANVGYATDVDLNAGGTTLARAHALLFGGHSEYWTTAMRAHLERYFATGVNAAFFGGNTMFWRPVPVGSSAAYRTLQMYRLAYLDPYAHDPARASEMWRDAIINRPEQATLGSQYGCDEVVMPMTVPAPSTGWIFSGTGAQPGQVLPGVNGSETDYPNPGVAVPAGTQLVTQQTFACPHRGLASSGAAMTLVPGSGPHGGLIVDAGTEDWACNLSSACPTELSLLPSGLPLGAPFTPGVNTNDPVVESVLQRATRNILDVIGTGPAAWRAASSPYPLVSP
jgi:hypothetical protein